jgi:hypothetical protein
MYLSEKVEGKLFSKNVCYVVYLIYSIKLGARADLRGWLRGH